MSWYFFIISVTKWLCGEVKYVDKTYNPLKVSTQQCTGILHFKKQPRASGALVILCLRQLRIRAAQCGDQYPSHGSTGTLYMEGWCVCLHHFSFALLHLRLQNARSLKVLLALQIQNIWFSVQPRFREGQRYALLRVTHVHMGTTPDSAFIANAPRWLYFTSENFTCGQRYMLQQKKQENLSNCSLKQVTEFLKSFRFYFCFALVPKIPSILLYFLCRNSLRQHINMKIRTSLFDPKYLLCKNSQILLQKLKSLPSAV